MSLVSGFVELVPGAVGGKSLHVVALDVASTVQWNAVDNSLTQVILMLQINKKVFSMFLLVIQWIY